MSSRTLSHKSTRRLQVLLPAMIYFLVTLAPDNSLACDNNSDCEIGYYCDQQVYFKCLPCSQCIQSSPSILGKCLDDGIPLDHSCSCSNKFCAPYRYQEETTAAPTPFYLDTTTTLPTQTSGALSTQSTVKSTTSFVSTISISSTPAHEATSLFPSPASNTGGNGQSRIWIIVGLVIGGFFLLCSLLYYCLKRRRRNRQSNSASVVGHRLSDYLERGEDVTPACPTPQEITAAVKSETEIPLLTQEEKEASQQQQGNLSGEADKRGSSDSGVGKTAPSSARSSPSGSNEQSSTDLSQITTRDAPVSLFDITENPAAPDHPTLVPSLEDDDDGGGDYMQLAPSKETVGAEGPSTSQSPHLPRSEVPENSGMGRHNGASPTMVLKSVSPSLKSRIGENRRCYQYLRETVMKPEVLSKLSEHLDPGGKWKTVAQKLASSITVQRLEQIEYHHRGNINGDTPTKIVLNIIVELCPLMEVSAFITCLHQMGEEDLLALFAQKWHPHCSICHILTRPLTAAASPILETSF